MVKRVFAFVIAASIVITACGHKAHTGESGSVHTSYGKSLNDSELPGSDIVNTIIKVPDKEGNSKNISIKQIAKNSMVTDDKELKPETIIDLVMLELDDLIDNVTVNVIRKNDSITLDLNVKNKDYPFGEKNQISEVMVLDCISYSIFDNFTDYKKIYFKLNGEAYKSKQLKLSDKKPFMADE